MATFSFEPELFRRLNNVEKGIIKQAKGSKKNARGKVTVSEQFFYKVVTAEFVYQTTFLRKEASESDKIEILKRRKKPLDDLERAELRKQENPDWKQLVWDTDRDSYNINYVREVVDLDEHLQIDSVVKRGKFDWIVEDVRLVPLKGTESTTIETVPDHLHKGHLYGSRLIVKATQLDSPVNRVISKLCAIQNNNQACISGQLHETVKTCHASREKIPTPYLNDVVFKLDKFPHRRNKLEEIQPLMRGDYAEHIYFNEKGEYEGRDLTVAAESHHKGWKEHSGDFAVTDLGVSEKYKPLSLPSYYKECDTVDKPDAPVTINLSEAEKKLKAMGFL